MTSGNSCLPMCQQVCINSRCMGNNICRCHSGYYAVDHYRCLPKCEPSCGSNMACLAPNRCVCKPEYKKLNESHCEPICSFTVDNFECINARCVAPSQCECNEGYRNISHFQCEPICENCVNGECVAPEVCECSDGYEKNSNEVCAPICDPSCINGKCVAPNSCECDANHEKYLKSHECLEKNVIKDRQSCHKSCKHGTCSESGVCVCESGYEMYNGKCSRTCDKECANGMCLEDLCVCSEDYKLAENGTTCLPICSFEDGHDCLMGTCVAPQTCKCFDGYRFLDDRNCTCIPMCEPMCINGVCTEDGCICHENFYSISDFECIKNCSEGFTWVYDECIEDMTFDSGGVEDETTTAESETESYDEGMSGEEDNDDESTTQIIESTFSTTTQIFESRTSIDFEGSSDDGYETERLISQQSLHKL